MKERRYITRAYWVLAIPLVVLVPFAGCVIPLMVWGLRAVEVPPPSRPTLLGIPASVVLNMVSVMLLLCMCPLIYCGRRMQQLRAETEQRGMLPCLTCGHTVMPEQERCTECGMDATGTMEGWTRWRKWIWARPPRG